MARDVFVDTSGFYSCLVSRDDEHDRAAELLRRAKGEHRFLTTDYVLDETITLLKMRGQGHHIEEFLGITLSSTACRIEWMDAQRFETARAFLLQHEDHDYSFTDCFSFCIMSELGLQEALTKDEHFQEAGFRPLLV